MDRRIKELYNDTILTTAFERYGIDEKTVKKLGGFESYIYEYGPGDDRKILRIAHSYHRSMEDLHAEMEWVDYLCQNGADVAGAVHSANGLLAEKIESIDSYFIASSIEKAPGKEPDRSVWGAPLFKEWGRAVGKLHRLTKDYVPKWIPRFHWHDEYLVKDYDKYLPKNQMLVIQKTGAIINQLKKLDKDRDSYGLIHTDIHHGNFFYDGKKITIFDFDDCAYKHFISDIAIAVFYSMMSRNDFKNKEDFAEFFIGHFMNGYCTENSLDDRWMKMLPEFLKLRETILYVVICRSLDPDKPDKWCLNYIKEHRESIEKDTPVLLREII